MKKILSMIIITAFVATSVYCADESYFLTVGTGGITGTYYPVGVAIGKLINQQRREHNIRVEVIPTGGSVANINALAKGFDNMAMAIVQSDVQYNAYNGVGAFTGKQQKNVRALFGLYSEAYTVVARNDSGIGTFKDMAGKRFNLGNVGSGTRITVDLLIAEYGWTTDSFISSELSPSEMVAALCENKIDAFGYVIGNPNAAISEAIACGGHLVPVSDTNADKFIKKYPFFPKAVIPAGTYKDSQQTVSLGPKATFVVTTEMPDEVAYEITKTVYENFNTFIQMHPALKSMRVDDMLSGNSAPYHPGAIKYYKEIGIWKD